jgi:hypothetical protein
MKKSRNQKKEANLKKILRQKATNHRGRRRLNSFGEHISKIRLKIVLPLPQNSQIKK